jgi:hypothetical protein
MDYWIAAYGASFVAIVVLYGIVKAQAVRRTGSRATNNWLLPVTLLVAFLVTVQAVFDHLTTGLQDRVASVAFLLGAIFFWGFIAQRVWRTSQAGPLLLDLGRLPHRRLWFFGICSAIGVLAVAQSVMNWRSSGFHGTRGLAETLFWLTLTIEALTAVLSRLQIRENGIFPFFELIEWERIDSHEWAGERGEQLIINLRRRMPFFGLVPGKVIAPVPAEHEERVERLLAEHCSPRRDGA